MSDYAESPFGPLSAVAWPSAAVVGIVFVSGSTTPLAPGVPIDYPAMGDEAGHIAWRMTISATTTSAKQHAVGQTSATEDDWSDVPNVEFGYYTNGGTAIDPCNQAGVAAYRFDFQATTQLLVILGLHPVTACESTGGDPPALPSWIHLESADCT